MISNDRKHWNSLNDPIQILLCMPESNLTMAIGSRNTRGWIMGFHKVFDLIQVVISELKDIFIELFRYAAFVLYVPIVSAVVPRGGEF